MAMHDAGHDESRAGRHLLEGVTDHVENSRIFEPLSSQGRERVRDPFVNGNRNVEGCGALPELRRDYAIMSDSPAAGARWFAELAVRYGVCPNRKLSEFALRLASEPYRLWHLFGPELDGLLSQMIGNPALLRGSRLLALLCANHDGEGPAKLTPRWQW